MWLWTGTPVMHQRHYQRHCHQHQHTDHRVDKAFGRRPEGRHRRGAPTQEVVVLLSRSGNKSTGTTTLAMVTARVRKLESSRTGDDVRGPRAGGISRPHGFHVSACIKRLLRTEKPTPPKPDRRNPPTQLPAGCCCCCWPVCLTTAHTLPVMLVKRNAEKFGNFAASVNRPQKPQMTRTPRFGNSLRFNLL